jgi:serine/threonine protein phosphatase 1
MRTLVMGDIHGAFRALEQCLERCHFDPSMDNLIQLGDVVDRGPQTFECVEYLLSIPKLIAIRGNHDDWFHDFLETGYHTNSWKHGGMATILFYGERLEEPVKIVHKIDGGSKTSLVEKDIPLRHQQFFTKQSLYHIDDQNNCFVHAGFERRLPFFEQPTRNYYWSRKLWLEALAFSEMQKTKQTSESFQMETSFREIFLGHTPTTNWGTDHPMHVLNIWNLDTGAGNNGRLTVMDLDTKEYWQSDSMKELY